MARAAEDKPADQLRQLGRFERWTTDWRGEPNIEWDRDAHAEWCASWCPSCPDGNPQRVRRALGFRERNECELELRIALGGNDSGVCAVVVDEQEHEVYVRVVVDYDDSDDGDRESSREHLDCPVRVWLDRPLGARAVIDEDSDEELDLFTFFWDENNEPRPDHGYSKANRRLQGNERPERDAESIPVCHQR